MGALYPKDKAKEIISSLAKMPEPENISVREIIEAMFDDIARMLQNKYSMPSIVKYLNDSGLICSYSHFRGTYSDIERKRKKAARVNKKVRNDPAFGTGEKSCAENGEQGQPD